MDEEVMVAIDELEVEEVDDAQLGDAVTTGNQGPGCYCGSM